ncbi:MAG TPA: M20/M25/M40 family metallo-hydrolase [Patescibacteria group bacterium]|nr:M20/M25/M40 family metallo-hydrolase [Patescibacteria group bacterium]
MKKNLVETFIDLVKIDSPSGEEEKICVYIQKRLSAMGVKSQVDKSGNLFAKVDGVGVPVILSAHMDTVEPGKNIKPKIINGVIKSDGTTILGADNKIAIASIINALQQVNPNRRRSLEIVFSVREETDGGIADFDFSLLQGRTGILADKATDVGIIELASPWIENLEITINGLSAHSGSPEKGINALTVASNAITNLDWGRINDETTSNIGVISGGSVMNTIPEKVFLQGEVRSFSRKKLDNQIIKIKKTFESTTKKYAADLGFIANNYCNGYVFKKSDEYVDRVAGVMKSLGIKPKYEIAFGGSDANTFIKNGINLVNIGDGGRDPHTLKESVTIADLEKIAMIFTSYIQSV